MKLKSAAKRHSITIHLNDRAYALLVGVAGYDNYGTNKLEEMVLRQTAGLAECTYEGLNEQEAFEIFGVDPRGRQERKSRPQDKE